MNPPPPPPALPAEEQIHISRDGVVLGVWPASEIRPMLISGDLKPSDHFWTDGADTWQQLVTAPPSAASPYPYLGDDRPLYFIREGLLYGPRTAAELDVLHDSGWLGGDALMTVLGADQWWTINEFAKLGGDGSAYSPDSSPAEEFDWIGNGIRAYVGDPGAGVAIGIHAVKRAFRWLAELPSAPTLPPVDRIESPPDSNPSSATNAKLKRLIECPYCGTPILVAHELGMHRTACHNCLTDFTYELELT